MGRRRNFCNGEQPEGHTLRDRNEKSNLEPINNRKKRKNRGIDSTVELWRLDEKVVREAALWESEERFRSLGANIPGAIYRRAGDSNWTMAFISEAIREISGYIASDFINNAVRSFANLIHPEDKAAVEKCILEAVKARQPYILEYRIVRADGSIQWVYEKGQGIFDKDGKLLWLDGAIFDPRDSLRDSSASRTFREQELSDFSNNEPIGLHWVRANGYILRANQAELQLLGYSREEYIGHHISEFHADEKVIDDILESLTAGKMVRDCEARLRCKDGSIKHVLIDANGLWDDGKFIQARCFTRDITERKKAEEALKQAKEELEIQVEQRTAQLRKANEQLRREIAELHRAQEELEKLLSLQRGTLEATGDGIIVSQNGKNIATYNQKFVEMWGICEAAIAERDLAILLPTILEQLKEPEAFLCQAKNLLTQPDAEGYGCFELKDGRIFEHYSRPQRIGENIVGRVCSFRDITERVQSESALRESEERYRAVVEQTSDGIFLVDIESKRILEANRAYSNLLGYYPGEILKLTLYDVVPTEPWKIEFYTQRLLAEKHYFIGETRQRRKDGSLVDVEVSLNLISYGGKQVVCAVVRDISDRKKSEKALRESEERFRQLAENIQEVFWLFDVDKYEITYISPAYEEIWGRTCKSLYEQPRSFLDAIHPMERARVVRLFEKQRIRKKSQLEFRIVRPDGSIRWICNRAFFIKDESGQVYRVCGIARDITERKQMEEALKGTKAELEIRVEERTTQLQNLVQQLEAEIAERQRAEAAVRESSERFRNLVETTSDWVWEVDENAVYTYASPKVRDLLGYEPSEVLGKTPFDLMEPEEARRIARLFGAIAALQKPFTCLENANIRKDGRRVVLETSGVPIFDSQGKFRGYRGIDRDITERKEAEEALKKAKEELEIRVEERTAQLRTANEQLQSEIADRKQTEQALRASEERYRRIIETTYEGVWIIDAENQTVFANNRMAQMLGYTLEEIIGKPIFAFLDEEGSAIARANLERRRNGIAESLDFKFRRQDGSELWVLLSANPIFDERGQYVGALGMLTDITARKQAEEALTEKEKLLRLVLDNIPQYICWKDRNSVYRGGNINNARLAGFDSPEQLVGKTDYDLPWKKEEADFFRQCDRRVMETDTPEYHIIEPIRKADGNQAWLDTSKIPLHDASGKVVGILVAIEDITYRMQAEEALRNSEATNRALLNALPDMMLRIRSDGTFVDFKAAKDWEPLLLNTDEILGKKIYEVLPEEVAQPAMHYLELARETDETQLFEYQLQVRGNIRDYEARYVVIGKEEVLCIVRDITERKQMEQALRKSEERYRRIIETTSEGVWIIDAENLTVFANNRMAQMLGYTLDEMLGIPLFAFLDEESLSSAAANVDRRRAGIGETVDCKLRRKDGSHLWAIASTTPIFDEGGQYAGALAMLTDITERKRVEEALRQSTRRLRCQNRVLAQLAKSKTLNRGNLNAAVREIAEAVARTLETARVSVWLYDRDRTLIRCVDLYELQSDRHSEGFELLAVNYPAYFKALQQERSIAATDVNTDPRTKEFSQSYLIPLGISSMLDAPIWLRGQMVGVVCHEHVGQKREWTLEEENFAGAIADLVSLALEAYERRLAEEALLESRQMLQLVIDNIPQFIFWKNRDLVYLGCNRNFAQVAGVVSPENIVGKTDYDLAWKKEEAEFFRAGDAKVMETNTPVYHIIEPQLQADGKQSWLDTNKIPLHDAQGNVVGILGTYEDISDRKLAEATIQYQATHDLLTGLPNRALFNERLLEALENVRGSDRKLAVMFLDLDRFKIINDTLGHAVGDRLLQGVALRVTDCLRALDTLARWGGDEFTLLLPEISAIEDAAAIAQRMLDALKLPFHLEGHQLHISSSIGIALYPCDGSESETLLRNADAALYRAKEQGRNNYQFYTAAMNSHASELLVLENELHHALKRGEFVLYYQPQFNAKTGEITGMEALLRWQHPQFGLVSPSKFIPLAEETGLIVPIGEWVLKTACAQNKVWQDSGLPPIRVAVNLSARQFQQPQLAEIIGNILCKIGLKSQFLELEITETVAMKNVEFTRALLSQLQQMGVYLSIDDFGTGYSSINYLKQFPIQALKIDQSFVRDLTNSPKDARIINAITILGKSFDLRVVAEGVETEEQKNCLRSLDCEEMQGYLFSKPLSAQEATRLLQNSLSPKKQTYLVA